MTTEELNRLLAGKFTPDLAAPWDNDGIMVCADLHRPIHSILVALDPAEMVIRYAIENGFDALVTHHPLIFEKMGHITPATLTGRKALLAIENHLSVLSYHTRMDAGEDGVNDALCKALWHRAEGTFGDGENPTLGRYFTLAEPMLAGDYAVLIRDALDAGRVRITGDPQKPVRKVALCGGDGKDFVKAAMDIGADLYLTGDAGYNVAADAAEEGLVVVEAGHYHTEAPICRELAAWLCRETGLDCTPIGCCPYGYR